VAVITGERLTEQAIYNVVLHYAKKLGIENLAPHDLRRTFAKLAHKGGSGL
jgi:integrase/recombinase XerD